ISLVVFLVRCLSLRQYHYSEGNSTELPRLDRPVDGLQTSITQPEWLGDKVSIIYCISWANRKGWFFFRTAIPLTILCYDKDRRRLPADIVVQVLFSDDFLSGRLQSEVHSLSFKVPDNTVFLAIQFDHSDLITDLHRLPSRHLELMRGVSSSPKF